MHNQPREPQPYEDCQAKSIQAFGWTSEGMDWGWGQGIKSHHTQTCQGIWLQLHQRRLTWAKEKKNWTVAQWSKVLFSDKSKFCISFGNQGPRVWRKFFKFLSTSCFLLLTSFLKMLISFSSSIWHLPTLQKHQRLVKWPWCWCAWLASKLTRPEPYR